MPFVRRDRSGKIIAVFRDQEEEGELEYLEPDDPAVVAFLSGDDEDEEDGEVIEEGTLTSPPRLPQDHGGDDRTDPLAARKRDLSESDFQLIRAIEDLINLLSTKGVISETELPEPLQNLLERRRALRHLVQELHAKGLTDGF